MGRWQPDSRARLERAALELFVERGFEQTTVAQIAARAGLTERTFFRHFADKREVLFGGGQELEGVLARLVAEAPAGVPPLEAIVAALEKVADEVFAERQSLARQRQSIVEANPELQERELLKLASLSGALARTLRERGIGEPAASLAAESGVTVFKVAFVRWLDPHNARSLAELVRDADTELRALATRAR